MHLTVQLVEVGRNWLSWLAQMIEVHLQMLSLQIACIQLVEVKP